MAEEDTKDLTDREVLNLILARLGALEADVGELKAAEVERRRDTRPKLDAIHAFVDQLNEDMKTVKADVSEIKRDMKDLMHGLNTLAGDLSRLRGSHSELETRVSTLERKPS